MLSIQSSLPSFNPFVSAVPHLEGVHFNAKQTALATLTLSVITLGVYTYSIGAPLAKFVAVACFTIGAGLCWVISRIKNYDDPASLKRYRERAKTMPLEEVIKEHGIANIVRYEIFPSKNLQTTFKTVASYERLNRVLELYELFEEESKKSNPELAPPDPAMFREAFENEVKYLKPLQIFAHYDVPKLYRYGIASKKLMEAEKRYSTFIQNYREKQKEIKKIHSEKFKKAILSFMEILSRVNGGNPTEQGLKHQLIQEAAHLLKCPEDFWSSNSLKILQYEEKSSEEIPENLCSLYCGWKKMFEAIQDSKKTKERDLELLEKTLKAEQSKING